MRRLPAGIATFWWPESSPISLSLSRTSLLDQCLFVRFGAADIAYPIVGMSDVMPYASSRFRDLSQTQLQEYEAAFAASLKEAVTRFQPDIIHSHHLWIVSLWSGGFSRKFPW